MADYINDAKQVWHNLTGNSAESFSASPDFNDQLIHGFSQMVNGENPTSLLQAQAELMKRGWGPETSTKFLKEKIGILQQAQQFKEFNAVQKENAPQPEFMKTVTPSPAERDSMELGGFDPNQNESLSKMMPATPEKQMTPNQAVRIMGPGKAWDNPSQVGSFLQVPQHQGLIEAQTADAAAQASQRKTAQRIEDIKQRELEGMNAQAPVGEPSDRSLALFPSLANRLPQRDKATDPLEEDHRKVLQAQAQRFIAGAGADAARGRFYDQRDRTGGRGAQGSEVTTDQEKATPAVMTGTFQLAPKGGFWEQLTGYGGKDVEPQKKLVAERTIARAAEDRGVADLPPEQQGAALGAIADEFGFKLSGTPTLRPSSSARTTKTTTRGDQGGAPLVRNAQPPKAQPAQKQPAMIRVKEKASGRTGSLPAGEFDPKLYERIQ